MFRRIVLPTDGSQVSLAAVGHAISVAKCFGAQLYALHVLEPYPFAAIGAARKSGFDDYMAASHRAATLAFERIAQAAAAQDVPCKTQLVEDAEAARGIVLGAVAASANLIVMGSHGRSGVVKFVLGSVAIEVLRTAPVPVLIVK